MLAQILVGGVATGCIYAIVGLGFTLIYRTMRMVNFAQGQVFMAGTFLGLVIANRFQLPAVPLILVVGAVASVIGLVVERVIFRRLYHNHEVFVVGSIGLGIVLTNAIRVAFPEPVPFPKVFGTGIVTMGGAFFQISYVWVVGLTVLLVVGLHVLFALYEDRAGASGRCGRHRDGRCRRRECAQGDRSDFRPQLCRRRDRRRARLDRSISCRSTWAT